MKIANRINLSFFVVVVILTGISLATLYRATEIRLKRAVVDHLKTTAQSRAHHIDSFLEANKEAVKQLSKSIVIEQFLAASEHDEDYDQKLNNAMRRLKSTAEVRKCIHEIFVLNTDGKIVASSNRSRVGLDKSTDIYFLGAQKGTLIKDAYYSNTTKQKSMAVSAPITAYPSGEFLGVIAARLSLAPLNAITTDRTGLGKTGEIYVVNKYGYMITPSRFTKDTFLRQRVDTENTRKYLEDVKKFGTESHEHHPVLFTNYRGVESLGTYGHIHQMQWCLCTEIDEEEVLAPLATIRFIFIIILCTVPVAVWIVGTLVSRAITAPIHRLHEGTEIIGKGNLDYRVATGTKDEIGRLSCAFDKMTRDLKESHAGLEKKVRQRTETLTLTNKKLQGQIAERRLAQQKLECHIRHLNCLFDLSRLIEQPGISLDEVFEQTTRLIQNAYQVPQNTCVRITFNGTSHQTDNFSKTELSQHTDINIHGDKAGAIDVYYLADRPENGREPFLAEERDLLGVVAEHLGRIAGRKQTGEKLQLFRDLLDRSNDAIYIKEPKWGRFLEVNQKACDNLGYTREELLDMSVKDIEPAIPDDAAWTRHINEIREKGAMVLEGLHKRKDGTTFPVEVNVNLIEQEKNSYVLGVARDITERKKAEQRQAELLTELESVNQELKDFAYIVSHDLKAPLRGIRTVVDWILEDYTDKLDDRGREQLGLLGNRTDRMDGLIEGILEYSRVGRVREHIVEVDLNKLLPDIIDAIAPPENISITIDGRLPLINCEETRIIQLFQNLLSNAVKYMDKPQGRISIACTEQDGFWKFSVADNGPGIEQQDYERIFQIFQTLAPRDEVEGTGVGLTVVRKIVELYGGRIWVESKVTEGSTFFFTLPKQTNELGVEDEKLEKADITR